MTNIPFSTGLTNSISVAGQIRFNTTTNAMEMYTGTSWQSVMTAPTSEYKLICEERRVSGARYFTVKPEGWLEETHTWREMMEWCVTTFGPSPEDGVWTAGARWYANNAKFWFRNQKDRDWFIIRWNA
jgi:hypothetical protein